MPVYVPTAHSKIRYCERVDSNYNHRDEDVRLAKKYGLTIKDVPKKFKRERNFLGYNKIYYNDKIYIFSNSECYKLITIYNNTSPILRTLFDKKERLRKEAKKKKVLPKNQITTLYVKAENRIFKLNFQDGGITKIEKIKEEISNLEITKHPISKYISWIYKGDFRSPENYLNLNNLSVMEKAIYYEVLRIPRGKAITFKDLAQKLNNQYSIQAIVYALKNCPFMFLIPSHRVIRSDGKIGSYCGKPRFKKRLLRNENIKYKP